MIFFICAMLTVACFFYVFNPSRSRPADAGEPKGRLAYLHERKDVVYENLRDLNFEFKAGKFPEADYTAMRAALEDEAAAILAEMDTLAPR